MQIIDPSLISWAILRTLLSIDGPWGTTGRSFLSTGTMMNLTALRRCLGTFRPWDAISFGFSNFRPPPKS